MQRRTRHVTWWWGWRRGALVAAGGLLTLVPMTLLACRGKSTPSSTAVAEVGKLVPLQQGQPLLVFVYTDG